MMSKSVTIIEPIHPGEILKEEFLDELGISASLLARRLGVPPNRVTRIVAGQSAVTAETAMLLSRALGTTPEFWVNLQAQYDLESAKSDQAVANQLEAIDPLIKPAAKGDILRRP